MNISLDLIELKNLLKNTFMNDKSILIIGNGKSILSEKLGLKIDTFSS